MKEFEVNRVLAPTDLTDSSAPAMRYARVVADAFQALLTVVYSDPVMYPVSVTAEPEYRERLHEEVVASSRELMEGRPFSVEVTSGQPIPAVLSMAKRVGADIIVVGTHLRHGWRKALLGSVSEGILHGAHCPVLTVASREKPLSPDRVITSIMCPVNLSDVSRDALRVAAKFARAFDARLLIVHVIERNEIVDPVADEATIREWIGPDVRGVPDFRELVVRGGAAERVLDCAEDVGANLLVVGAQHRTFRDSTVIGTTTERLIRFSSCPVLVVPREAVSRGTRETVEEPEVAMV